MHFSIHPFQQGIIPTYFDNQIVFASFLSKLYRWGFSRLTIRQTGLYEFRSPTFRRLSADSAPANAAINTCSNAGGGASIQVQQQPNQASSSLLQQVMALINQPPPPNPPPSQADAIANLITNIQRQRSSQQPSIPSQQSVLNQNSNQPNNTDATGILQIIVGSSIQMQQQQPNQASSSLLQQVLALINQSPPPNPPPSQADAIADLITNIQRQRSSQQPSIPSQHSALNHQLNMNLNLQPTQQRQNPNPTMNLLNAALSILVGSQTPSAHQRNAIQALMSLYGMLLRTGTFPNTNASPPAMPQLNNMPAQSLLMLIHRVCEDERQRRVQADATQNAIIANIGQILGLGSGGTRR